MDVALDVVVVGAGIAGLSAAAQLASAGLRSVEVSWEAGNRAEFSPNWRSEDQHNNLIIRQRRYGVNNIVLLGQTKNVTRCISKFFQITYLSLQKGLSLPFQIFSVVKLFTIYRELFL